MDKRIYTEKFMTNTMRSMLYVITLPVVAYTKKKKGILFSSLMHQLNIMCYCFFLFSCQFPVFLQSTDLSGTVVIIPKSVRTRDCLGHFHRPPIIYILLFILFFHTHQTVKADFLCLLCYKLCCK